MVEAAVEGFGDAGTVLAVTLLTSMGSLDTGAIGMPPPKETVPRLAAMATKAGAHGLVCAAPDLHAVSQVVPVGTVLVTPGIRPAGASTDDQTRVATPGEAIADGADLIVVGRPITQADDPWPPPTPSPTNPSPPASVRPRIVEGCGSEVAGFLAAVEGCGSDGDIRGSRGLPNARRRGQAPHSAR
jgi:hypothetical protein